MNTPRRLMFLQAFSSDAESHLAFLFSRKKFWMPVPVHYHLKPSFYSYLKKTSSMAITVYNAWANYMYVA